MAILKTPRKLQFVSSLNKKKWKILQQIKSLIVALDISEYSYLTLYISKCNFRANPR